VLWSCWILYILCYMYKHNNRTIWAHCPHEWWCQCCDPSNNWKWLIICPHRTWLCTLLMVIYYCELFTITQNWPLWRPLVSSNGVNHDDDDDADAGLWSPWRVNLWVVLFRQIALGYVRKYGVQLVRVLTLEKNRGKGGAVRMVCYIDVLVEYLHFYTWQTWISLLSMS